MIRNEVTKYVKDKLEPQCPPFSSVASERAFKVAKNLVGDTRLRLRLENVEMNLFLKYNLRAINYEIDQLKTPLDEYLAPNSLNRDYTDDDSDE